VTRRRLIGGLVGAIVGIAGFSLAPWFGLAFPFLVLGGLGYLTANASATARLQLEVHESQRGRIMALWSIAFLGVRPFASLVDGAVASATSVHVAGVLLTLPAVLAVGLLVWRERRAIAVPTLRA
jgi:hypothetical protein